MTGGEMRDGTPRAGSATEPFSDFTAISFVDVHKSIRAAHLLREQGFDVLVAARRTAGCGVVVLVDSDRTTAAVAALNAGRIEPREVAEYRVSGGIG